MFLGVIMRLTTTLVTLLLISSACGECSGHEDSASAISWNALSVPENESWLALTWSQDSRLVAAVGTRHVIVWDCKTRSPLFSNPHGASLGTTRVKRAQIRLSPTASEVAVVVPEQDFVVRRWSVTSGKLLPSVHIQDLIYGDFSYGDDSDSLVVLGSDGRIGHVTLSTMKWQLSLLGTLATYDRSYVSRRGEHILALGRFRDGVQVRTWTTCRDSPQVLAKFPSQFSFGQFATNDGADYFVGAYTDLRKFQGNCIVFPNPLSPATLVEARVHLKKQGALAIAPHGCGFIAETADNKLTYWDTILNTGVVTFSPSEAAISRAAIAPNSRSVVTAHRSGGVHCGDLTSLFRSAATTSISHGDAIDALGSTNSLSSNEAYFELLARGKESIAPMAVFAELLNSSDARIAELVSDLDNQEFEVRERSVVNLSDIGSRALALLDKDADAATAESRQQRKRVRDIITSRPISARVKRIVSLLEAIDTPEAAALLLQISEDLSGSSRPSTSDVRVPK